MAAHQVPLSLGFSRQEHWSGLPFPSPVHESEKWKWSRSVVSDPQRPHGLQPSRLLRPWDFPRCTELQNWAMLQSKPHYLIDVISHRLSWFGDKYSDILKLIFVHCILFYSLFNLGFRVICFSCIFCFNCFCYLYLFLTLVMLLFIVFHWYP